MIGSWGRVTETNTVLGSLGYAVSIVQRKSRDKCYPAAHVSLRIRFVCSASEVGELSVGAAGEGSWVTVCPMEGQISTLALCFMVSCSVCTFPTVLCKQRLKTRP